MRILLFILFFISSTTFVCAQGTQGYVPIVGVPGLEQAGGLTAQQYVEALYKLSIAVGAMLAVIQIIFAGVQYMLTDVITSKSDAISRIRGALLGLVILLGAVLILETINPDLLNLNIFSNAPSVNTIKGVTPKELAPAKVGDSVSTLNNADALKNLEKTCPGSVGSVSQGGGKAGGTTVFRCYPKGSSATAVIGGTFTGSQYAVQDRTEALESYKKSCRDQGGVFKESTTLSNPGCDEFVPEEDISIGSTPAA